MPGTVPGGLTFFCREYSRGTNFSAADVPGGLVLEGTNFCVTDPVAGSGHRTNRYGASATKLTAGRQAAVLPCQLGEANPGPVGPERREWVCDTLHATVLPNAPSAAPEALRGGGGTLAIRDMQYAGEASNRGDHTKRARFPVHPLPGRQEKRGPEARDKHQTSNL